MQRGRTRQSLLLQCISLLVNNGATHFRCTRAEHIEDSSNRIRISRRLKMWTSRREIAYCSAAVISFNDFWKPVWAKSYLGAIGRNFVWATAALAPWLPRPWIKPCEKKKIKTNIKTNCCVINQKEITKPAHFKMALHITIAFKLALNCYVIFFYHFYHCLFANVFTDN